MAATLPMEPAHGPAPVTDPGGAEHVHTAENIRNGVEHSLRTLRTDNLDLVQFHRSLARDEFDAAGALAEALAL